MVKGIKKLSGQGRATLQGWLMMALPLGWWVVFFLVPLSMAFYFSFTNLKLSWNQITEYGFFQYVSVLTDPDFWDAVRVTFIWTVVMTISNNVIGFLMAYMISRLKRCRRLFLTLLFWPTLVSAVVSADITQTVFGPYGNDLMNIIIGWFGHEPIPWLEQESTALFSIMFMPMLFSFCVKMIIFYAAILSIPQNYYDALQLESNSFWVRMRYIVLPLIKDVLVLNILLSIIDGLKVLGPMQLVTNGNNGTRSVVLYIYQLAFESPSKGKASAAAFVVFVIILVVSLIQLKLSGKAGDSYE